jgi:hypothetical protein
MTEAEKLLRSCILAANNVSEKVGNHEDSFSVHIATEGRLTNIKIKNKSLLLACEFADSGDGTELEIMAAQVTLCEGMIKYFACHGLFTINKIYDHTK